MKTIYFPCSDIDAALESVIDVVQNASESKAAVEYEAKQRLLKVFKITIEEVSTC